MRETGGKTALHAAIERAAREIRRMIIPAPRTRRRGSIVEGACRTYGFRKRSVLLPRRPLQVFLVVHSSTQERQLRKQYGHPSPCYEPNIMLRDESYITRLLSPPPPLPFSLSRSPFVFFRILSPRGKVRVFFSAFAFWSLSLSFPLCFCSVLADMRTNV